MWILRDSHSPSNIIGTILAGTTASVCLGLVFGVCLLVGGPSEAAEKRKAPTTVDPKAACATAECHTKVAERRYVHEPVSKGECRECHAQKGRAHKFTMVSGRQLCRKCHDSVVTKPITHQPVENCFECHRPHDSKTRGLIKFGSQKELCFECHEDEILDEKVKHGPAWVGACSMCHDPHSATQPKLLNAAGPKLCEQCHEQMAEAISTAKSVHNPVSKNCTLCHNPHSGPFAKMLPAEPSGVCEECHDEIYEQIEEAAVDHEPVISGDRCLNCHAAHASNAAPSLKAPQAELCLSCHNKPVKSGKKELTDIKALLDKNRDWHGPIREGNCAGCHQPHSSENFRLLLKVYPPQFYSAFDPAKYALCFECHEETMVAEPLTRALTEFRDGDRNLHFLHINKANRGRTCRACHEVHASTHARHIRDEVPYGDWALPINFEKTETGGSCQPGCHPISPYDRDKDGA